MILFNDQTLQRVLKVGYSNCLTETNRHTAYSSRAENINPKADFFTLKLKLYFVSTDIEKCMSINFVNKHSSLRVNGKKTFKSVCR